MSATTHLAGANLRHHARRYVATTLAIALSLSFVLVALSFGNGLSKSLSDSMTSMYQGSVAVVMPTEEARRNDASFMEDKEFADTIANTEGVSATHALIQSHLEFRANNERVTFLTNALAPEPFERPELAEGRFPEKANEIAVEDTVARALKVTVGDTIETKTAYVGSQYTQLKLVGIVRTSFALIPRNMMTSDGLEAVSGKISPFGILVASAESTQGVPSEEHQEQMRDRISAALAKYPDANVITYDRAVDEVKQQIEEQDVASRAVILLFPIIAVMVALIVVASTFRVVMNQRQREIALLRTLGGTTPQVRRLILLEAVGIGVVAAVSAVVFGALVTAGGLLAVGMAKSFLGALAAVSWVHVAIICVLSVVLAVGVGLRPALGASKTKPMAALASASDMPEAARRSFWRTLPTLVVFLAAVGAIGYGVTLPLGMQRFLILLLASVVSLVTLLILLAPYFPGVARSASVLAISTLPNMARGNLMRNPGRTSATGIAIIIGVTLVSTMMVGASSLRATLDGEVDARRPIDLKAVSLDEPFSASTVEQLGGVPGVKAHVVAHRSLGRITLASAPEDQATHDEDVIVIEGQPDLNKVAHSPITLLAADQVLVPQGQGIEDGNTVRVCLGQEPSCGQFTAKVEDDGRLGSVVMPEAALLRLDPDAQSSIVYISLTGERPVVSVQSDLLRIAPESVVEGAATEREMYTKMIDTILMVVLGMLAVSVIVAVVGVANTLSLSVHERTRENGLLRALGLTRRQMRRLLVWEALFISMTATVIGLILGVAFATVGMYALPTEVGTIYIQLPWDQLGIVLLVSLVSTLLAAWLPSRRAARTSPVEALGAI